ncbi:NADH:ubiquinone oxidoreductase kDa subunit [Collybia nuda]|uniref:NADH:ubiquinone oxidoreductase kDa subunit n=1 Tax=Collybia nuda TaxID=64659 RepID=A0A9P5Y065_9AGAR|nr:NADH:ubiquinone oxidoreductase kDa subunit [Collybia nuda]
MLGRRLVPQLNQTFKTFVRAASSSHVPTKTQTTSIPTSQAPNYTMTWSTNQQPRPAAASSPRFEQTAMDLQPNPLSAMELIAREPVRLVNGRKAVCDGGGGPLGHPKVFINLDRPGPRACGGIQFEQAPHHH